MPSKKIKWLIYTVLVGLVPVVSRFLIWLVTAPGTIEIFSAPDFVAFGLVLHISNINEIEHFKDEGLSWKTVHNGLSVFFICIYGLLFGLTTLGKTLGNTLDINTTRTCAMVLALVSLIISYTVFQRISQIENPKQKEV